MTITIEATYENGVFRPKQPVNLQEGTAVRVTITATPEVKDPLAEVIGICKEGPDISLAERHDEILYGLRNLPQEEP